MMNIDGGGIFSGVDILLFYEKDDLLIAKRAEIKPERHFKRVLE
jgi:hypothetical protein